MLAKIFTLDNFLERYFKKNRGAVIQVGANDGKMCDPLGKYLDKTKEDVYLFEPL